ncbi:MAG: GAF domain-containing protein [Bacteroidota bacterium]
MVLPETQRLEAVRLFAQYDFDLSNNLHGLLKLATDIYQAPAAFITLIDEHDQWFKVNAGFEVQRMPRETSFCTHVIAQDDVMIISDALLDSRFATNPLVCNAPGIRFYAGAPLSTNAGHNIGTLCVMDVNAKIVPADKCPLLGILAQQAIHLMELELTHKLLKQKQEQVELKNRALMEIAFVQSHEFRGPLSSIMGFMNLIKDDEYESPKEYLMLMEQAVANLDEKIHSVVRTSEMAQQIYLA